MTEPIELLPCPFCGGQARRSSGGAWFGTGCDESQHCPAYLYGLTHRSQSEADAAWNTRTPQPTQAQAGAVPLTDEQLYEERQTAIPQLFDLAQQWADNKIHSYQFANEAEKIVDAVARRVESAHGIKGADHA